MVTALKTANSVYLFDNEEKMVTGGLLGNEYHRYTEVLFADEGCCAVIFFEDEPSLTTSRIEAKWEVSNSSRRRHKKMLELEQDLV